MEKVNELKKISLIENLEDLLKELKTDLKGLSQGEAERRLKEHGENIVSAFKIDILEILKNNFFNLFNLLLLIAGLLSFYFSTEGKLESILILLFFLISVFIATYQDYRTNKFIQKLLSYFKNYAFTKRDNKWLRIEQKDLVVGDYVKLKAGDFVPADIRVIKAENLLVDESVFSGETEPVAKSEKFISEFSNILFLGSYVVKGEVEGIVVQTGRKTLFGNISAKALEIKKETIYKRVLNKFSKMIFNLALAFAILIMIFNFFKPHPITFKEIIIFAIVLVVALVPELLTAMTVLSLSFASAKLAKEGLVVKRLSALEDLGLSNILCTDKTGTLTTNKLSLKKIITNKISEEIFIKYFLAIPYFTNEPSPYDLAFLDKYKISEEDYSHFSLVEDFLFDPVTRSEKILVRDLRTNELLEIIRGAPETIIKNYFANNSNYLADFEKEDKNGFRTLSLAIKKGGKNIYLGLSVFEDPLKESTYQACELARALNIELKILTGDSLYVARKVALELNLIESNEKVYLGEEIRNLPEDELKRIVLQGKVFARVNPDDKFRIVNILKKAGKNVAFLGEGINDLLAIKSAFVSLVVDSAADVSKHSADVVMKEKDLLLIVKAIYEGRRVVENIGKYIKHTISDNLGNITSIGFLSLFLPFVALKPVQVLLTNFLTDLPLLFFSRDKVSFKNIRLPVVIDIKRLFLLLFYLGLIAGSINIIAYFLVRKESADLIRTFIFFVTTLTGLAVSVLVRNKTYFWKETLPIFLLVVIISGFISTVLVINAPIFRGLFSFTKLTSKHYWQAFILVSIFVVASEIIKILFYRKFPDAI